MYQTKVRDDNTFADGIIGVSLLHIDHQRVISENILQGKKRR